MKPAAVATLATIGSLDDLEVFLKSLELWNTPVPDVYLFCDDLIIRELDRIGYKGKLILKPALVSYTGLNRHEMERKPGKVYSSLWFDFMAEKINLLAWALDSLSDDKKPQGVLFLDADICHFGELPDIQPTAKLAVSPHFIRQIDEERFGEFNGGFFWTNTHDSLEAWSIACHDAYFFEQSAIEDVVMSFESAQVQKLSENVNYGWWRMFQGRSSVLELAKCWSIKESTPQHSGIYVGSEPLLSVHTHFKDKVNPTTVQFNVFVYENLKKIKKPSSQVQILMYLILKKASWLAKQ